ncbi:MAG: AAA family ATPase [Verrucomicrobia bacterium]|nr:AAA family ATPase [Verrucomicrobiota bacterium]
MKGIFVASTGQHVGKTTTCLGLLSGLQKRLGTIGYMKPVGQEQALTAEGLYVDKDVILFKEHFHLNSSYEAMSPVLIPSGFTRDYLDGKIEKNALLEKIQRCGKALGAECDFLLVEGTGHCGVGSIIDLNNAQVAAALGLPLLLIASGGLGSAFDDLMLNKTLCDHYGVDLLGVILNRVLPPKQKMIATYMTRALERWKVPLLGCIPFDPLLSSPTMQDFEGLFQTTLLTGKSHRLRHFKHTRLVATTVENYRERMVDHQLLITPANREEIILATLTKHWDRKISHPEEDLGLGMILTGDEPPRPYLIAELEKADIPMLYAPVHSDVAMQKINAFTAKIRNEDIAKVQEAITLVENQIDFGSLSACKRP